MPKHTAKPAVRQDAPPFPHKSGRWAKKVNGRFVYLGAIKDDPTGERAAEIWRQQRHAIRAGRKPIIDGKVSPADTRCDVDEAVNRFLAHKLAMKAAGELGASIPRLRASREKHHLTLDPAPRRRRLGPIRF